MRILITGATGFIGGTLASELAGRGERVICLVRRTSDTSALKQLGAELVYGDVTDEESLSAVPACDVIFHCAARVENRGLRRLRASNVDGTEHVCRLALRLGVRRLVYVSSVAVVSGNPGMLREDMPYAATNNYGISKIEAERVVLGFRDKGLPCAILRPPMIYGEEEPHSQDLLLWALAHRFLPLVDRGEHLLHLGYIRNVVAALILAKDRPEFLRGIYFAGDDDVLTVAEAFGIFASAIGAPAPWKLPPSWTGALGAIPLVGKKIAFFRKDRVYDTSRIKAMGYKDAVPAREALSRTGAWWRLRQARRA